MDTYQKDFIENLKKYRNKKKLSQAALAEICGVATGTIGNLECGLAKPSFDLLVDIAKALDVHPSMLLSENKISSNNPPELNDRIFLENLYERLKVHLEDDSTI